MSRRTSVRRFIPVFKATALQAVVVYFLTGDNRTRAVAVDFDQEDPETPLAYLKQARHYGLSACLERSRRRGWHAFLFFDVEGVRAATARGVAHLILSEIMQDRVEVFPKQDRLASDRDYGCFLNAPMFGRSMLLGRTVFVDPARGLQPYPDQWEFLAGVRRFNEETLQTILDLNAPVTDSVPRVVQPSGSLQRTYGLPPRAQRMLAEGVRRNQRSAAFRLACRLRKAGLGQDLATAALLAWAPKNQPEDGKGIITQDEIVAQVACAYHRSYRGCGCDDPAVAPFCDPNCPVRGRR